MFVIDNEIIARNIGAVAESEVILLKETCVVNIVSKIAGIIRVC